MRRKLYRQSCTQCLGFQNRSRFEFSRKKQTFSFHAQNWKKKNVIKRDQRRLNASPRDIIRTLIVLKRSRIRCSNYCIWTYRKTGTIIIDAYRPSTGKRDAFRAITRSIAVHDIVVDQLTSADPSSETAYGGQKKNHKHDNDDVRRFGKLVAARHLFLTRFR